MENKMPKLPTISEITSKVKSAVDSLMGPGTSQVTEEAIAKESDPTKAKLLEIELLINQLHDVQLIQAKTINSLKIKYAALHDLVKTTLAAEKPAESPLETETGEKTPPTTA